MTIGEMICSILSIPNIDDENGQKYFSFCNTWIEEEQKLEKRYHISLIRDKGDNCLYVHDYDILDIKVFKKMGGPSEYYYKYPRFFYKKGEINENS